MYDVSGEYSDLSVWQYPVVPWPLAIPMTSLVWGVDAGGYAGNANEQGLLVPQPDAQVLRQLRNNQHACMYYPCGFADFVPISENGGPLYALYVRDVIPIENGNGYVQY
jgi:hypothetical protein